MSDHGSSSDRSDSAATSSVEGSDDRPLGDTPWRRFRDEAPSYDGYGERHLLTWSARVATYDVGCIDGEWTAGEAIKGHPDDLWRWLDVNPERHLSSPDGERITDERRDPHLLKARALAAVEVWLDWCHNDETLWDAFSESATGLAWAERRRKAAEEAKRLLESFGVSGATSPADTASPAAGNGRTS